MSNNVIEILIPGGSLDLFGNEPISLKLSNSSIKDITQRKSNFSQTFTLPGTRNNNQLFNNIFEIGSDSSFNPNLKTQCTILLDTVEVMTGNLQLTNINVRDRDNIIYEVVIFGEQNDLITNIGEGLLTDIDYSELDHTLTLPTVLNSWTGNTDYYYPLIDYGYDLKYSDLVRTQTNPNGFTINKMYPAVRSKFILDKILSDAGYTYTSNFLNSTAFTETFIPYNGTLNGRLSEEEISGATFQAGSTINSYIPLSASTNVMADYGFTKDYYQNFIIPFNNDSTNGNFDNGNNFTNSGLYEYTADTTTSMSFGVNVKYDFLNTGNTTSDPIYDIWMRTRAIGIEMYRSSYGAGGIYPFSSTYHFGGYYAVPNSISMSLSTGFLNNPNSTTHYPPQPNERFWARLHWKVNLSQAQVSSYSGLTPVMLTSGGTRFFNTVTGDRLIGLPILVKNFIPKNVKKIDYFKSLILMHNLIVDVDKDNNNNLIIEPRDDYYGAGTIKDWTSKLDLKKDVNVQLISSLQPKKTTFTYKQDKDYLNQDYFESTTKIYGENEFTNDNEFNNESKKIEVIFSPTPCENVRDNEYIIVPKIGKVNQNGSFGATDSNIRVLYKSLIDFNPDPSVPLAPSGATLCLEGVDLGSIYPCLNHLDNPLNGGTKDLNFGTNDYIYWQLNEINQNNLVNTYWLKTLRETSDKDSKLVTCYLKLSPQDINAFRFNDNIFIDGLTSDGGHYFKVNSIEYIPTVVDSYKVELIKTKDIIIEPTTTKQLRVKATSPIKYTSRNSLTLGNNDNYGTGTIVIGENNYVTAEASKMVVMGDNNNVSTSINGGIVIGDSNYIVADDSSLSKNVFFIGDNQTVTAATSNTVYIPNLYLTDSGATINGVSINNIVGLWSAGTGTNSITQISTTPNIASGDWSIAVGVANESSGIASHAEGATTTASGDYSHAEGDTTIASGEASHAEGNNTVASGNWSHAEGRNNEASGNYSHTEGYYTEASGFASHAGGYGSMASSTGEWARSGWGSNAVSGFGQYGFVDFAGITTNATTTEIFIAGNSVGSERFSIVNGDIHRFRLNIIGRIDSSLDTKEWEITGLIKNNGGTTSMVGSTNTSLYADAGMATASTTISADNTNDSLKVEVTGIAATTITWYGRLEYTRVG